ncbi:MAG: hypothetical protein Q8R82_17035 [Hyphomonadaceae bacterium]|nr:hypothetical protein [Hyphomonadaceae bacterium]
MNRRELLAGAGAVALAACTQETPVATSPVASVTPSADPFAGSKLMADVESYVGFGTHRTGSPGDVATSDWFAKRWRDLGYEVEQTEFPLPNADTNVAKLRIGDEAFDGFAQPPLSFTPEGGVNAPLAWWNDKSLADVSGKIALVHVPRQPGAPSPGAAYRAIFEKCRLAGAVGIVALMSGPSGEVVAINTPAEMLMETPVLQLGEKERPRLEAALASNQPGKLIIEGPGGFRNGKNTIARHGTAGPWVIISTPQSGWFTCGGERGPGIAMSRALSEWALTKNFPVRWLFIATSGHEWTDFGADIFHESQAPDPKDTAFWFHLGASFGARAYQETPAGLVVQDTPNLTRTLMATPDLVPLCEAAFAGQPVIEKPLAADISKALGEYRLVAEEGYPTSAGFWGANAKFHTPIDGADSTTPEIMEPVARAIAQVLEARLSAL